MITTSLLLSGAMLHFPMKLVRMAEAQNTIPASLNLSAPTSPALDLLGISASKATTPTNLQQAAWALLNAYGPDGKVQQGIAYTASLADLHLMAADQNLDNYWASGNFAIRAKYRTRLSLGLARASDSPQGVSMGGVGISVPLLDHTDWRSEPDLRAQFSKEVGALGGTAFAEMTKFDTSSTTTPRDTVSQQLLDARNHLQDLIEAGDAELAPAAKSIRPDVIALIKDWKDHPNDGNAKPEELAAYEVIRVKVDLVRTKNDKMLNDRLVRAGKLVAKFNNLAWNREKLDFAAAGISQAEGDTAFKRTAYGVWGAYARPLGNGQGLIYAKYSNSLVQKIGDMAAAAPITGWTFAGRIKGGSSQDGYFAEYQYQDGRPAAGAPKVFSHVFQLGWEHKVGDQWIQLGIGKDLKDSHKFIFGLNIAFDTSSKRTIDVPGQS